MTVWQSVFYGTVAHIWPMVTSLHLTVTITPTCYNYRLPIDFLREELGDKTLVVGTKCDRVWQRVGLGVQVVGVESENILQCLLIGLVFKVSVGTLAVPGIERVVSDHVERSLREG